MPELSRDQLLEDLQAKRAAGERGQRIFTKRTAFFSACVLVMFGMLVALLVRRPTAPTRAAPADRVAHLKRVADRLKVQSLPGPAMRYYARYLDAADIPPAERANVCYIIADLAVQAGRYEDALGWLASAEQWGPADSLKPEVGKLQRLCFERLGRPLDADYQLASTAALDRVDGNPRGAVVAMIGKEKITMGDIDDAIQALPKYARDLYSKPGRKLQFVQQYVNTRILYRKAQNLGFDKKPQVRKRAEAALADLVVQAFLQEEVRSKVQVSDSELKLYYQVHQTNYGEPAQVRLAHIVVGSQKLAAELIGQLKAGADFATLAKQHSKDSATKDSGGEIPGWIAQGQGTPAMPGAKGLDDAVLALKPGDVAATPVKSQRGFHVVKLIQKKDARIKPLSEVRKQVEAAYRAQKEQERLGQVLKDAHKQLNVQIFLEALATDAPADSAAPKKVQVK